MAELITRLPRNSMTPESTADREGFLHAYDLTAAVDKSVLKVLLRDFDTCNLTEHADLLRKIAKEVEREVTGCRVDVEIDKQYRNLGDGLQREPRAVAYAEKAHRRLGNSCQRTMIRGGTDGSQLTELGLPTPYL